MKKLLRYYLPVVLWLLVIFFVPTFFLSKTTIIIPLHLDKAVHVIEFFIFGYLMNRALYYGARIPGKKRTFILMLGIALFIGAIDELYQIYIPGRVASLYDFSADVAGALCSVGLFTYIIFKKTSPPEADLPPADLQQ